MWKSGLVLNPSYPHFGASPDVLMSCDCCGIGSVEMKCPFCVPDKVITDTVDNIAFLEILNGCPKLKTIHAYYYQVQTQIFVCKRVYCDLVTWTQGDMTVERIVSNEDFLGRSCFQGYCLFQDCHSTRNGGKAVH